MSNYDTASVEFSVVLTPSYLPGKLEKYITSYKVEKYLHTNGPKITFSNQNQIS